MTGDPRRMADDRRVPDPRMIPPWQGPPSSPPAGHARAARAQPEPEPEEDLTLLRPFIITGGRTRPLHDGLQVETLIQAAPAALHAPLRFELSQIVRTCQTPRSIAEIAVALGQPLGVTRVLVADLVTENLVRAQRVSEVSLDLIERIRAGVLAL